MCQLQQGGHHPRGRYLHLLKFLPVVNEDMTARRKGSGTLVSGIWGENNKCKNYRIRHLSLEAISVSEKCNESLLVIEATEQSVQEILKMASIPLLHLITGSE